MTGQSTQGSLFFHTGGTWLSWQTAVTVTLNSESKFIDHKEPAAIL